MKSESINFGCGPDEKVLYPDMAHKVALSIAGQA